MCHRLFVIAVLVLCVLGMCGASGWCDVIHVKTTGNDSNDGLSWGTAKRTVQTGLDASAPGDQVWVAAGTYVERITLPDGVALYGGFLGTEGDLGARNWTLNQTVIDGSQGGQVSFAFVWN